MAGDLHLEEIIEPVVGNVDGVCVYLDVFKPSSIN